MMNEELNKANTCLGEELKMKFKSLMVLAALTVAMTACTKVESKEYYEKHPEAAKKVLQACEAKAKNNKDIEGKELENCQNAAEALIGGMMSDLMKGL